jgi:hypothetical protein
MQRTFLTSSPETLENYQVIVDLPRYEIPLARALLRRDIQKADKFLKDSEPLNVVTTVNNIKTFVDELQGLDPELDAGRIPYTNYVGLGFKTTGDAVKWARTFVARFFPNTEEKLLKKTLLTIPLSKTEIIWLGGEKYLGFVEAIATSPSTDELVKANSASNIEAAQPQLTMEDVKRKRAEIAARQAAKKNGIKDTGTSTVSPE